MLEKGSQMMSIKGLKKTINGGKEAIIKLPGTDKSLVVRRAGRNVYIVSERTVETRTEIIAAFPYFELVEDLIKEKIG
jgi:hypothetical protein